jgi:hypothetical protein
MHDPQEFVEPTIDRIVPCGNLGASGAPGSDLVVES